MNNAIRNNNRSAMYGVSRTPINYMPVPEDSMNYREMSGTENGGPVEDEPNFCTLSTPEDDSKKQIDSLLDEYTKLRRRMQQIHTQLGKLGFHSN